MTKYVKCDYCGTMHDRTEKCICNEGEPYYSLPYDKFEHCIICGNDTDGKVYCQECWFTMTWKDRIDELNDYCQKIISDYQNNKS